MRRVLVALLAALTLASMPAAFARDGRTADRRRQDASDFTFFGSGFGHGLGMSQWGAFGLARQGWGATRILTHYYSGTRVAEDRPPADRLRIGLVQSEHSVRIEAQLADVELRLGERDRRRGRDRPRRPDVAGQGLGRPVPDHRRGRRDGGDRRRPRDADRRRLRAAGRARARPRGRTHLRARLDRARPLQLHERVRDAPGPPGADRRSTCTGSARSRARGRRRRSRPRRSRPGPTPTRRCRPPSTARCATARCTRARSTRCTSAGTRRPGPTATDGSPRSTRRGTRS